VIVATTFAECRRLGTGLVGLVPTMGFLHEGHLSHIAKSAAANDTTIVSLFVNPTQFDDPADLERYPRDFERDRELAFASGADVLFAPEVSEMYPGEPLASVVVDKVTDHMEGPRRPGHFEGVATVVAKLLAGIQPDVAYFGRKDAQQVAVVTTMARDLSFPVRIEPGSTVRESEGLALSSRNVFLSQSEREQALAISKGLFAAADLVEAGASDASAVEGACRDHLDEIGVEYVQLADQAQAQPLEALDRPAFLAVAATVGTTRLIDNVAIDLIDGEWVVDRGERLVGRSMLYGESDAAGR
jgi:pantoate--beta-alanine ligase